MYTAYFWITSQSQQFARLSCTVRSCRQSSRMAEDKNQEGSQPNPSDVSANGTDAEPGVVEPKVESKVESDEEAANRESSPEQLKKIQEMVEEFKVIFPNIQENWLRRAIIFTVIEENWDLERALSWIYEYEDQAPSNEKVIPVLKHSVLMRVRGYENAKNTLEAMKHEVDEQYKYFAEVKLGQKFPQFSAHSLRQVLHGCDFMYPMAVLNIMEGLERAMREDDRLWEAWKNNENIYITVVNGSDGEPHKYPLCVVKGENVSCGKKANLADIPHVLAREIRLVEKTLCAYNQRFIRMTEKLNAESAKEERLQAAMAAGTALECPICMETVLPEDRVSCTKSHEFCPRCLQEAVKEAATGQLLVSPQGDLPCIIGHCDGNFSLIMLCHMLPPESLAVFEEHLWTSFLATSGIYYRHRCPKCGYPEAENERKSETLTKKDRDLFECQNPRCRHRSCRQCKNLWSEHNGGCKESKKDPETELRKKYEEMMSERIIRRCVRCKKAIIFHEGSSKIMCQCGQSMCYLCGTPIIGYTHYCSHLHSLDNLCPCGKCKLSANDWKVIAKWNEKLQAQMQAEFMELKLKQNSVPPAIDPKPVAPQAAVAGVTDAAPVRILTALADAVARIIRLSTNLMARSDEPHGRQ